MEINSDLIRGHIDTIILKVLSESDRYGYDIIKEIVDKSLGQYQLKVPTLYSCLKRLEVQGYIVARWGPKAAGGRRKYYTLTDDGILYYNNNQAEWEFSRTIIDRLISDRTFDLTEMPDVPAETEIELEAERESDAGDEYADSSVPEAEAAAADAQDGYTDDGMAVESFPAQTEASERESAGYPAAESEPYFTPGGYNTNGAVSYYESASKEAAPVLDDFTPVYDQNGADTTGAYDMDDSGDADDENNVQDVQTSGTSPTVHDYNFDKYFEEQPISPVMQQPYYEPDRPAEDTPQPTPEPKLFIPHVSEENYRSKLSGLFANAGEAVTETESAVKSTIAEPQQSFYGGNESVREIKYQDGIIVKRYSATAAKELNSQSYYYINKLKFNYFALLGLMLFFETLVCTIIFALALPALKAVDIWFMAAGFAVSILLPALFYAIYKSDPKKRRRIDFELRPILVYRFLLFLVSSVIVFTFNIVFLDMNAIYYSGHVVTLFLPLVLCTTLPVSAVIYHLLYKSEKYSAA